MKHNSKFTILIRAAALLGVLVTLASVGLPAYKSPDQSILRLWGPDWAGTGFVVQAGNSKVVLTNAHVCANQLYLEADQNDGSRRHLIVIAKDEQQDLCALVAPSDLPALHLGRGLSIGQHVWSLGHPLRNDMTRTYGVIIGYTREMGSEDLLLDMFVFGGASGSPLLNEAGDVIGCVHAGDSMGGHTLAIDAYQVRKFLSKL